MLREGLLFLSRSAVARRFVTGAPVSRSLARRFVPGERPEAALEAARRANEAGYLVTLNYLGEAVGNRSEARAAADLYVELAGRIRRDGLRANLSVKLTQLGQDIDEGFVRENARRVAGEAAERGLAVTFDMESSAYTQRTLDLFEALWDEGHRNLGIVLQAYLFRSEGDARRAVELGAHVRLCKGAYREPPSIAYQRKADVDANFVRLMRLLLDGGRYPGIATHDERMIARTRAYARERGYGREVFEFQLLYGVRRDLARTLVRDGYNVRLYIPFGEAWYPYLMRRLAERPANVLFLVGSLLRESPFGGGIRKDRTRPAAPAGPREGGDPAP